MFYNVPCVILKTDPYAYNIRCEERKDIHVKKDDGCSAGYGDMHRLDGRMQQ